LPKTVILLIFNRHFRGYESDNMIFSIKVGLDIK
jgi:hypothetical protein